jgi:putative ABC transport system permease protein
MGVDRVDFAEVAFWRHDFAPADLRTLMNALGAQPDGVLVPRDFMAQHGFGLGDRVRVTVDTYGQLNGVDLRIVGGFDLFPTWYPEDGPLFVGNLDYLYRQAGGRFPYRVWLKTTAGADFEGIGQSIRSSGLGMPDHAPAPVMLHREQLRPERQGLFGVVSIGFLAAAVFAVLGVLLHVFFSFRRRFIELGVLRALGLSSSQMRTLLTWELAFIVLIGAATGTALGAWISELFIPDLQLGAGESAYFPPFAVEVAWQPVTRVYALLGVLLVTSLAGLVILLRRMRIFEAVKLGETT